MCGLFGFIGIPSEATKNVVFNLGLDNERRGKDSSGIAYAYQRGFIVNKKVDVISNFLKTRKANRALESSVIIGHTRLATHGEVNWKNAHPFRHGKWIFAHNGVISNFEELNLLLKKKYKVDSQVIGGLLPDRINLLRGSFAIVAINTDEPDRIYFWRNFSPLFVVTNKDGLFFSSLGTSLEKHLPGERVKEVPNYSHGIFENGKMSYNIELPPPPIMSPILLSDIWLIGPDGKGEYHATSYAHREETVLERLARFSSCRSLEQGLVC